MEAGEKKLVAQTAVARKMITIINARLREHNEQMLELNMTSS